MCGQIEQVQLLGWPIPNNSYPTTAHRLFTNGGYDVPLGCWPGTDCKEGALRDTVGAADTVSYIHSLAFLSPPLCKIHTMM